MKLTILGNNGPFPSAGGACSGYLVREGPVNILIDCGNGVLSNLQKYIRFEELDAIILTHLHSDHMSDMMVLRYAVQIKHKRGQFNGTMNVFAPSEPAVEYQRLETDAFDLKPITQDLVLNYNVRGHTSPDNGLNVGECPLLTISFMQMKHPVVDFAVSLESGGRRFVFSGDTSWTEKIISFAKDADLLMLDAGLLARDKTDNDVPHLTAEECGIIAREAGVKKLLLTHFWPEYDIGEILGEAKGNFKDVEPALLFQEYII